MEHTQQRLKAEYKSDIKVLTSDGVHMNGEGNKLMAIGVLQAFGLNAAELKKENFYAAWHHESVELPVDGDAKNNTFGSNHHDLT